MPQPLLSIRDLRVRFAIHGTTLEAVRGVSFDIMPGATVALVGESGRCRRCIPSATKSRKRCFCTVMSAAPRAWN